MTTSSSSAVRPALAELHHAHVQRCLDLLQEAQGLCRQAAEELCPVPGFGNQWSALIGYESVRSDWHLVAGRLDEMLGRARDGRCPACGADRSNGPSCPACGFRNPPDATK